MSLCGGVGVRRAGGLQKVVVVKDVFLSKEIQSKIHTFKQKSLMFDSVERSSWEGV